MPRIRRPMPEDFPVTLKNLKSYDRLAHHYRAGRSTLARWKREHHRKLRDAATRAGWKKCLRPDSELR